MQVTTETQADLRAYKELEIQHQVSILGAVSNLVEMQRASGNAPSASIVREVLTPTGNFQIALSCYIAQMFEVKWI